MALIYPDWSSFWFHLSPLFPKPGPPLFFAPRGQLPQRRLAPPGRPPGAALPRRGARAAAGDAPGTRAAQRVAARGERLEGNEAWDRWGSFPRVGMGLGMVWFGTFIIFPYSGNNDPNWLIFFRGVETTNQFGIPCKYRKRCGKSGNLWENQKRVNPRHQPWFLGVFSMRGMGVLPQKPYKSGCRADWQPNFVGSSWIPITK